MCSLNWCVHPMNPVCSPYSPCVLPGTCLCAPYNLVCLGSLQPRVGFLQRVCSLQHLCAPCNPCVCSLQPLFMLHVALRVLHVTLRLLPPAMCFSQPVCAPCSPCELPTAHLCSLQPVYPLYNSVCFLQSLCAPYTPM